MAQLSLHARRRGETLEEERLSYLNLQRHPAMEYGEVRSVVALKRGVGDHSPERFADHEFDRNANLYASSQTMITFRAIASSLHIH